MTISNISNMPAGEEMDHRIAREIMGWKLTGYPLEIGKSLMKGPPVIYKAEDGTLLVGRPSKPGPWSPSLDISAAFEVVEKMREKWYFFRIDDDCKPHYEATFTKYDGETDNVAGYGSATAPTVPLAISRAALLAAMEDL